MTARSPKSNPPLLATSGSLMLGGSSTFLINLVRALQQRGWPMPIAVLSEAYEHQEDFRAIGAEVNCVSTQRLIYEDRLLWSYQQAARHQPRAVLACLSAESFEVLRLLPPGVLRMGIIQSDDPGPYGLPRLYAPWLDVMVGVSDLICERLRALPECARLRIECIPYGIHFPAALSRPACGTDAPLRVVYVGRVIETQKRISRLAALMRLLEARRVNVAFTIIGSGPDEATLKAAAADCRHVPITLLGNVPNHEVSALLSAQDVYVLLSDFEGLPLSLLEAMGNGVVPVVSDLPGGMQQVVSPDCGVRVPVGDVEAAATAITALATDRERLERLSATAVPKVRQGYSAEGMAARYLRVIEEGCAGKPAPSWPQTVKVPSPLVLNPWLYQGWPRKVRRGLKAILSKA